MKVLKLIYLDEDMDGYGKASLSSVLSCLMGSEDTEDCDDSDTTVFLMDGGDSDSEFASPSCDTILNVQRIRQWCVLDQGNNEYLRPIVI